MLYQVKHYLFCMRGTTPRVNLIKSYLKFRSTHLPSSSYHISSIKVLLRPSTTMPVTIEPANHAAKLIAEHYTSTKDPLALLQGACYHEHTQCKELLQSSFASQSSSKIYPSSNGFVHAAIKAYSNHHHLNIRPEDVWFAIIAQLSFYINRHAEELRGKFVAFEGKKELTVIAFGDRYSVDFGALAQALTLEIEKNVVDPKLREWCMPAFSTTTESDKIVASILLMGVVQKYFDFKCCLACGLPSVTLLGEKADWTLILTRLDKLTTFGAETSQFATLLKPVVSRFIKSFDAPTSPETVSFWQRIAHKSSGGSGPTYYSGWITAFCFWDKNGECMYSRPSPKANIKFLTDPWNNDWSSQYLRLDEVIYHQVESDDVPPGFSTVPVKVDNNGILFDSLMVAGSVGMQCSSSGEELAGGKRGFDTLAAQTGWWMFETKSAAEN